MSQPGFEHVYTSQRFIDMFNGYARERTPIFPLESPTSLEAVNPARGNMTQRVTLPAQTQFCLVGVKRTEDGKDLLFVLKQVDAKKIGLLYTVSTTQFYALFKLGIRFIDDFIQNVFTKERVAELVQQQVQIEREEAERISREEAEKRQRDALGYGGW